MTKQSRVQYIFLQLGYHLPYSIFGVTIALLLMGVLTFFTSLLNGEELLPRASEELFHITHASHILLSTVATTAMFWKHEKAIIKATVIGLIGAIGICSLSDIIFPFLGGRLLGMPMEMHICVIEHPEIILPFAVVGLMAGFFVIGAIEKSTQYSHSGHVLVSSIASLLYLLAYGVHDWVHSLGWVFLITVVSVMIPCCVSDIVFPLWCVHKNCVHGEITETYEPH